MTIDPTEAQEKEAQKMVIACAIDPVTKKPYPLVVNPLTGELVTSGSGGTGDLSKKTDQYWVSNKYGSDTAGDGGVNKPYKTIQKAVDVINALEPAEGSEIVCYPFNPTPETVTIPVGLNVSIIGLTGVPFSNPTYIDLQLNGFCLVRVTGMTLNWITELDADPKILLVKDCDLGGIIPATPPAISLIIEDVHIADPTALIPLVAYFDGTYRKSGTAGTVMGTVGSPLADQDLATKKYVDDNEFSGAHSDLTERAWSEAGHTIDTNLDLEGNELDNVSKINGDGSTPAGITSSSDIELQLGDNAGVKKLILFDSDGVKVLDTNSNGDMSLEGNITMAASRTVDGVDVSAHAADNIKHMKSDVTLAGATPVDSDISAWTNGDRGIGIGTGGGIYLMYKYTGVVKYVQLS
jgi:hypothetical protein